MKYLYQLPKIITLSGVFLFAVVKFYLRELNIQNDFIRFILNIYPNFLAGLMIPMLFLYNYELVAIDRVKKFDVKIKYIMLATLIFLIFEEYRPTFGSSKIFDYWDMIFSAIGLIVFYIVYKTIMTAKIKSHL
ncbi:MAG: hypothetical protein IPO72_19390 [Saprospiraceae bacterium]|nr:hypothetical protein [Candidatus Vicinibacter affinis]